MIESIDDAERWYKAVKTLALDMRSLARKWDDPALEMVLGRDNRPRHLTQADLVQKANTILEDLDDLAVLVFFSVFEATVRARTEADVDREMSLVRHPAVQSAINDLRDAIKNGSFGKITAAYKRIDHDLTEEVNQVRKFRNWVAHGRREAPESQVVPGQAIERLRRYLVRLAEVEEAGTISQPPVENEPGLAQPGGLDA